MASSILKVVFALSKSPHLHRELSNRPEMSVSHCAYLLTLLSIFECFEISYRYLGKWTDGYILVIFLARINDVRLLLA